MKKQKILSGIFQIINAIFITITIALLVIAIFKPDLIKLFLDWIGKTILTLGNWNYLIAFGSATIESFPVIGVLVPGMQIMLMVGGFFGAHNLFGVITLAIIGAIIGNYAGYYLGVKYGDKFFDKYGDYFGIGKTELKILKKQIDKNGAWFIILGKFHNFTRAFVPFIAGSSGMKHKHFWTYNIIGSIIWAITIITLGVVFAKYYETIVDYMTHIIFGILAIVALYIYFFKKAEFAKYWAEKNAEIEERLEKRGRNKFLL